MSTINQKAVSQFNTIKENASEEDSGVLLSRRLMRILASVLKFKELKQELTGISVKKFIELCNDAQFEFEQGL